MTSFFTVSRRNLQMFALLVAVVFIGCSPAAWSQELPEGDGREIALKACQACHGLDRLMRPAGHTEDEWENVMHRMIAYGTPLTKEQIPVLTGYLNKHYPNRAAKPVLIPGSVEVAIKEWKVPTAGSFPHDPLYAKDGSVWYTGIEANLLGRFDRSTEKFKEYRLKTPRSGPHGLVEDENGNIWFAAHNQPYIGKLDPQSGEVTEYKLPSEGLTKSPTFAHSPTVDGSGNVWFPLDSLGKVGRLVMKTGEIQIIPVPTPNPGPYGIAVNSKGVPFFAESRTNKIASIDPQTLAVTEYTVPDSGSRPRRIAITSDDTVYYTDYAQGTLGRFDPKTGKFTIWPSPGGPTSAPYGMTVYNDIVWYNESGVRPNTVVRFDPKSEKFQTWAIPSGAGVVRNMSPSPEGNIWMAISYYGLIGEVQVK